MQTVTYFYLNNLFSPANSTFTCVISVSYNFSDGDQLPILRDILDNPPGSNISLLWINSSVGKLILHNFSRFLLQSVGPSVDASLKSYSPYLYFYMLYVKKYPPPAESSEIETLRLPSKYDLKFAVCG